MDNMDLKQYIPAAFLKYDFKRVYSGMESQVYVGFDGNERIILKHGPSSGYYRIESGLYKELEKQGISAPRFIFSNDEGNILVISFMEGMELNDHYGLFDNKSIWEETANDLNRLKNIRCSGFGEISEISPDGEFKGALNNWSDFFKKTLEFISFPDHLDILTTKELKILSDYWVENKEKINLEHASIVHGDFCMDHIWTMNGKYSGLIDFGDAFIGDPLMDLAYFRLKEINKDYGKKIFSDFYAFCSYISDDNRSDEDKKKLINLYMIYWGIDRIINISEDNIKRKFGEKVRTLIREL